MMKANLRVHIAPVGFDPPDRICRPLIDLKADKVYLITRSKYDTADGTMPQVREVLKSQPHIEVKVVHVDIWDLFSCLQELRAIFAAESGNHVFMNVSTGTKIISIAGTVACMLWGGSPYYTKLDYESGGRGASSDKRKLKETEFLPALQIKMPSPQLMHVLWFIRKAGGAITKKALIKDLQSVKMIPTYLPSQPSAPHSRLKALLGPLEKDWGYIEISSRGRTSIVKLTHQGKSALRIFGSGWQ